MNYAANMLPVMIDTHHQDALHATKNLEFGAMDLRIAVNAVGEMVEKISTEDLFDSILSQFYIGK